MKSLFAVIALVVSANSYAYSVADSSVLTTASPFLSSATTSGGLQKAEANQIINDAQELLQSGVASASLAARIDSVRSADNSLSELEAVGILVDAATAVLSK